MVNNWFEEFAAKQNRTILILYNQKRQQAKENKLLKNPDFILRQNRTKLKYKPSLYTQEMLGFSLEDRLQGTKRVILKRKM